MQEHPGKNSKSRERENGRERLTDAKLAAIKATGQYPAIPARPPGMTRLAAAPETSRAPRPQHQAEPPKKTRRRFLLLGSLFLVTALIACTIGALLANGMQQSSGPATIATDFFSALSKQNYTQAYQDLGPAIAIQRTQQDFTKQAQDLDQRYGPIIDYKEQANSATNQGNNQSYTFTIKRSKFTKSYSLRITLQTDPNDGWKISDYGTTLGPG